jgi:hypothetical protein
MATRSAFKIENPSRGPGRVDLRAPDEGFGLEGTPKPKIQKDPYPLKWKTLYVVGRCTVRHTRSALTLPMKGSTLTDVRDPKTYGWVPCMGLAALDVTNPYIILRVWGPGCHQTLSIHRVWGPTYTRDLGTYTRARISA